MESEAESQTLHINGVHASFAATQRSLCAIGGIVCGLYLALSIQQTRWVSSIYVAYKAPPTIGPANSGVSWGRGQNIINPFVVYRT
jgi:hypothetical protein